MAKVARRDFLKLALAILGTSTLLLIGKLTIGPSLEASPTSGEVFSFWGQSDLKFSALVVPYKDLQ